MRSLAKKSFRLPWHECCKAAEESVKLEKLRQDFISNISHELRTPITVMRGSLEALYEGVITDEAKKHEYIGQMLAETVHLQRLVNDLLDLSKLQNSDFNMEMLPLNLKDVVGDVLRSMDNIAQKRGITLEYEPIEGECPILGDYNRIRQMLIVVIDNAIKFANPNSIVRVRRTCSPNGCVLSIENEGPGISPEELPYIFERFHKSLDEGNKNGTGLGLAIAKQIAQRHNIKINVDSKPNGKTIFSFVLPSATDHP